MTRITTLTELHAAACTCTRCEPWRVPSWTGAGYPLQTWWVQLTADEAPPPGFKRPGPR